MTWWQWALLALGLLWALQIVGTWVQMRHYQDVMTRVGGSYKDGFLGTGNAKGTVGRGMIVMLITAQDGTIRKALAMEGRTVLARFEEIPEYVGLPMETLADPDFFGPEQKARAKAFGRAIDQIKEIQSAKGSKNAAPKTDEGA